jgi:acyl-CoA hydrolase
MRVLSETALTAALSSLPVDVPRVVASGNYAAPRALMKIVDAALPAYRLFMLNAQTGVPVREGVTLETPFVGVGMRDQPTLDYIPSRLSLVPVLFTTTRAPDVVLLHTSDPRDGTVSMGIEVNILPAAVEAARARGALVVAQLNSRMPYTYGDGQLSLEDIDLAIEADDELPSPVARKPDAVSESIGDRVAALVPDGATLQLGIGGVPDATLASLTRRRGLKLWSEMFSDGLLGLDRAGAVDVDAPIVSSFVFGSSELYEWVDRNKRVRILRTEKTNDPALIAKRSRMISVNGALQVDLFAQANASRRKHRIYSGFGGQTDFIVGALHSSDGKAIIALPSWHPRADCSTVVPVLEAPITSFQHSHIITEQGSAAIWGCDQRQQARQIIDQVAHPGAREELRVAAYRLGLGP